MRLACPKKQGRYVTHRENPQETIGTILIELELQEKLAEGVGE